MNLKCEEHELIHNKFLKKEKKIKTNNIQIKKNENQNLPKILRNKKLLTENFTNRNESANLKTNQQQYINSNKKLSILHAKTNSKFFLKKSNSKSNTKLQKQCRLPSNENLTKYERRSLQ